MNMSISLSRGCSIIFFNKNRHILLLLRDNIPTIPYPGMWDLPGGHVEAGETPFSAIAREMNEEMGLTLTGHRLFARTPFTDRIEFTFFKRTDLCVEDIDLTEGQCIRWFSEKKALTIPLAYGFNGIVERFYKDGSVIINSRC